MAVLNGGYLVQLLFISLLDLVKKGTREMSIFITTMALSGMVAWSVMIVIIVMIHMESK